MSSVVSATTGIYVDNSLSPTDNNSSEHSKHEHIAELVLLFSAAQYLISEMRIVTVVAGPEYH